MAEAADSEADFERSRQLARRTETERTFGVDEGGERCSEI